MEEEGSQREGGVGGLGGMGRRVGGGCEGAMRGARGWRGKLRVVGGEEGCGVRAVHWLREARAGLPKRDGFISPL